MIKILHGENTVLSRKRLIELTEEAKKEGVEVLTFNGNKVTLSDIHSFLESGSLFGKTKILILENFLSSIKSKEKDKILEYLSSGKFTNDLILWEAKEIKGKFSPFESELFRLPPIIFQFLESLRPKNIPEILKLFNLLKEREEVEMVFHMLIRQTRLLLVACDLGSSGLFDLSPWQRNKLLSQSKHFNLETLRNFYRKLLEIDYEQKTSTYTLPLSSRLDLLLTEL